MRDYWRLMVLTGTWVVVACSPPPVAFQRVDVRTLGRALYVDVRGAGEYRRGHLPGARNIPVGDLAGRVGELGAKERPIVVYCLSGHRSKRAAGILRRAGFAQVYDGGGLWGLRRYLKRKGWRPARPPPRK